MQASTVSYSDCIIRQGKWWGNDTLSPPITPGVDFVGKICSVGDEVTDSYGFSPGDTVASLVRSGGNARYVVVDASKLIDVPSEVDPPSAACMLETYLAAFQSLHLGESEETRYEKSSMLGKIVLINGGIAMVGQAMIELAFLAGAHVVYVTAREKHHDFLRSLGAIPLSMKFEEWLPTVKGRMDLIVDAYCTNHYTEMAGALNPNGKMVCIRTKSSMLENDPGLLWQAEAFLTKMGMSPLTQTFAYDVYESWEENIDLCKDDMVHLFNLLRKGLVEPPIADCIPLSKVPQAQKIFESKRIQGYFVCEPWLKKKQKAGFC
jgi:NADPH:quinone reductase-like Zn-dependent oxidoreductase